MFEMMIKGVLVYVDGWMIGIFEGVGVNIINKDWMWYYVEGV